MLFSALHGGEQKGRGSFAYHRHIFVYFVYFVVIVLAFSVAVDPGNYFNRSMTA
jgi:hypothetical protein